MCVYITYLYKNKWYSEAAAEKKTDTSLEGFEMLGNAYSFFKYMEVPFPIPVTAGLKKILNHLVKTKL